MLFSGSRPSLCLNGIWFWHSCFVFSGWSSKWNKKAKLLLPWWKPCRSLFGRLQSGFGWQFQTNTVFSLRPAERRISKFILFQMGLFTDIMPAVWLQGWVLRGRIFLLGLYTSYCWLFFICWSAISMTRWFFYRPLYWGYCRLWFIWSGKNCTVSEPDWRRLCCVFYGKPTPSSARLLPITSPLRSTFLLIYRPPWLLRSSYWCWYGGWKLNTKTIMVKMFMQY